jgi:hypothetical protein
MDNKILRGETMSVSSLYIDGMTDAGNPVDGILWQDEESGLWQFQNGNDLGLIDYADDETPIAIEHTIKLPNGSVVAVVDLGKGLNSTEANAGKSFPEVYAEMLEWDAKCPQKEGNQHVQNNL